MVMDVCGYKNTYSSSSRTSSSPAAFRGDDRASSSEPLQYMRDTAAEGGECCTTNSGEKGVVGF